MKRIKRKRFPKRRDHLILLILLCLLRNVGQSQHILIALSTPPLLFLLRRPTIINQGTFNYVTHLFFLYNIARRIDYGQFHLLLLFFYLIRVKFLITPPRVLATVDILLIKISKATPTTSFLVSPTVSPTTAALWAALPFP